MSIIVGVFGLWSLFHYLDEELPDHRQLQNYDPPRITRLYASDGQLLEEYAQEHRAFVPIDYIPPKLIEAFLSAEDKNFYDHEGIDYIGTLRAAFRNLKYLGKEKRPMGASSITQQVAKNFLLSNEVSLKRKLKEAMLARKLEATFSKKKILELYLNEIYLGAGAYGVAAAALHYFNKSLQDLTLSEMAYLAGLPKAPNNYNLWRKPDRAKGRRDWVLNRMLNNGMITSEAYNYALQESLKPEKRQKKAAFEAKYFGEEIRQKLMATYGEEALYQGGMVVKTTLNPQYQIWAEQALRKGLVAYDRRYGYRGPLGRISLEVTDQKHDAGATPSWVEPLKAFPVPYAVKPYKIAVVLSLKSDEVTIGLKNGSEAIMPFASMAWARKTYRDKNGHPTVGEKPKTPGQVVKKGDIILVEKTAKSSVYQLAQIPKIEGAIVVMDPHTGRILALSGGYSFSRSKYNRATQANRQSGSAFKPFVYLAALEQGLSPVTRIMDTPIDIEISPDNVWSPNNISKKFYGLTTLRRALEKSYNVTTVRLAQTVGLEKIAQTAARFGVDKTLKPQWSVALGADETTLLNLVTGYAQLANGGKKITPIFIDRIQDRRGHTLHSYTLMECPTCGAGSQDTLDLPILIDKRPDLVDPRLAYQMTSMLQGVMERGTGRMGAIKGYALAGKTGSTNDFRDAWFVGYSPNLVVGVYMGFDNPSSLGNLETGARMAAPVFKSFMEKALKVSPSVPFRTPSGLVFKKIDADTGLPPTTTSKEIITEGLLPDEKGTISFVEKPIGEEEVEDDSSRDTDISEKETQHTLDNKAVTEEDTVIDSGAQKIEQERPTSVIDKFFESILGKKAEKIEKDDAVPHGEKNSDAGEVSEQDVSLIIPKKPMLDPWLGV